MANVQIGRTVDFQTLETAIRKAAKELGWKLKIKDKFERGYKLGSVEEERRYLWTDFNLRGAFLPAMQVTVQGKEPTDSFSVYGFPVGVALPREIRKYLNVLSKYL